LDHNPATQPLFRVPTVAHGPFDMLWQTALQQMELPVLITDAQLDRPGPQIVFVNTAFCQMTGYSAQELLGATPRILHGPSTDPQMLERMKCTLRMGHSFTGTIINRHKSGRPYSTEMQITPLRDENNTVTHYIAVQRPLLLRQPIERQAVTRQLVDPVTNLPNRYVFLERLSAWITQAAHYHERFAVCLIDLDRFNRINDTFGHLIGDDVLAQVALRLRDALSQGDMLARMGGDEFGVILAHTPDETSVAQATARLLATLETPIALADQQLFVSASIGVSLFPRDGSDSTTLLKHADSAVYRSKGLGRNMVSWFNPELIHATRTTLELDQELRTAVDEDQFILHYQPQINMITGAVVGVEALLRWQHPRRGLLAPAAFLEAAEDSSLMRRICSWALLQACEQAALMQRPGAPPLRVSVNISAPQFERSDIVRRVEAALRHSGLPAECLELEITESILMRDPAGSAVRITQLRDLGVSVVLDDFGTGYSSLAYLQQFPVDALKIDRSFVLALGSNPLSDDRNTTALLRAVVALAHSLQLRVVAEGIERPNQHQLLRSLGYDEGQGYLYARPVPAEQVLPLVQGASRATIDTDP
jgi:diguanylate cyclase (GGDEF)-like protein/PAS domain S-box-containing protein